MEEYRNLIVLGCIGLYMLLCIGVGVWAMKRTHSTQDFFMASRSLGFLVAGVAVFSSTMSGFGFVGGPGIVYKMGTSSFYMILCVAISASLSNFLLAKRLRMIAELRETVSLPDAVGARYGSASCRFLTAVAILLGVMVYLGTQILAMGTVLQEILQSFSRFQSVPLWVCMTISCGVLVFYCVTGGIIASVYTDLVQGLIMVVASIIVFITAILVVDGGFAGMSRTIHADDPETIGPWGTLGMMGCLSWYFVFTIGACGQPHVITKLMMTHRISDARAIAPLTVVGYSLTALLWIGIGLTMRALVLQGNHAPLEKADAAAPQFLQYYAYPIVAGVVFAGLFAAIMSTADSFLNIGAAAVVHDIPRALRGRSLNNELLWARIATVVIAVAAAVYALFSGELVALLGKLGWSTFAAAIVPVVAIGFNWKRATATAANAAIISSLVINFGLELFKVRIPHGIDPGAIALLVSLLLFFGISLASKPPKLDRDIEAVMEM